MYQSPSCPPSPACAASCHAICICPCILLAYGRKIPSTLFAVSSLSHSIRNGMSKQCHVYSPNFWLTFSCLCGKRMISSAESSIPSLFCICVKDRLPSMIPIAYFSFHLHPSQAPKCAVLYLPHFKQSSLRQSAS